MTGGESWCPPGTKACIGSATGDSRRKWNHTLKVLGKVAAGTKDVFRYRDSSSVNTRPQGLCLNIKNNWSLNFSKKESNPKEQEWDTQNSDEERLCWQIQTGINNIQNIRIWVDFLKGDKTEILGNNKYRRWQEFTGMESKSCILWDQNTDDCLWTANYVK